MNGVTTHHDVAWAERNPRDGFNFHSAHPTQPPPRERWSRLLRALNAISDLLANIFA